MNTELRAGYKLTEIGIIPKDWNLVRLNQMVEDNRIPSGVYKDKNLYGHGTKIIKLGDVFAYDYFVPDLAQKVELSSEEITNYRVKVGDIIIALASVKLEGVGKVMLVTALDENTAYDHNVALIRLFKQFDQRYIFYLFKSDAVRKLVGSRATQVGTTFLKTSTILDFLVPLPPTKAEQEAIAEALSDADALIESLEQLITKKRQIKQGAMQELLTGKTRLPEFQIKPSYKQTEVGVIPDVWDVRALHSIVRSHNSGIYKSQEYYGFGCNIVGVSDIYGVDKVDGQFFATVPLSSQERVKHTLQCNDLLYGESSLVREGIARTVYVTKRGAGTAFAWHTRRYSVDQRTLFSPYLYYYLLSRPARAHMISNSIQTAITGINTVAYFACPIIVPPLPEQTAIATILSDIDTEIDTLETKLAKTRLLKQGMMHNLLTGRVRLL